MDTQIGPNVRVLMEPKGFLRVLEFIFSICAFATTCDFSTTYSFITKCGVNLTDPTLVTIPITYPFELDHIHREACNATITMIGNFSSDAEFFVATGVLAFLYTIAIMVVYVLFSKLYESNQLVPLADFIITVILAVFWLSGSSAWANGLSGLQVAGTPGDWMKLDQPCFSVSNVACEPVSGGNFSGLIISVLLGFLNFILWAGNLWFIYKETPWAQQPSVGGPA